MGKIRISAVRYANTYPFIYGLRESGFEKEVILEIDHPADCAEKLITGKADVGLIPVGALPRLKEYFIISDYCIGANGKVRTVMLLSNSPFEDIKIINLDYRSRSSVNLAKVLAQYKWKKEFQWVNTSKKFDFEKIRSNEGTVLIGDQCFESENKFKYKTDLAEEWKDYTGLPFVFACWVSNKQLKKEFLDSFNDALSYGVKNIDEAASFFSGKSVISENELKIYLKTNIDFILDNQKRKAMDLFLKLLGNIKDPVI
jgi:chorismate dehydratase